MNLLIEYFVPKSKERYTEYLTCLNHNITNRFIDKIYLFIENGIEPPNIDSNKIVIVYTEYRYTYLDFFNFCNKLDLSVCILANADIMFDETLMYLNTSSVKNKFLALSRWDIMPNGDIRHYDLPYSQDVWIFNSDINIKGCNFNLGKLGCDNRITYLAMRSGLMVSNPSKKIVTKHLHLSNYRTVSSDNSEMVKGRYLFVDSNASLDEISQNIVVSPENVRKTVNKIVSMKTRARK